VYFPHNKCASTLYDQLFKKLDWQRSDTQDIDWSSDHVFSHIRNPLDKHYKGLVEGLTVWPEILEWFANTTDHNLGFLSHVMSIDPHSYSIYRYLGPKAMEVTWIPIDTGCNHQQAVFDFLCNHGVTVSDQIKQWFVSLGRVNPAMPHEQALYLRLRALPPQPDVLRYIDFDQCIYDRVTRSQGFEPPQYRVRMQELLQQGLSQVEAESLVDLEVANGQYLQWKFD